MTPKTMFEKIWDAHIVHEIPGETTILYIDTHLVHEITSAQAFEGLRLTGRKVRRPDLTFATMDHNVPTTDRTLPILDEIAAKQMEVLAQNCAETGITLYDLHSPNQGIVHVIGPELGITQPGKTIVCGDSHTSTHGALGALAIGIGTSEVEHVLATQCLLQQRPQTFKIEVDGKLGRGVTAKDIILGIIGRIGTAGGTGCVIEYTGSAIQALSVEERMTVCNMSIEAGARAGMIAPDDKTYEYLAGREFCPQGEHSIVLSKSGNNCQQIRERSMTNRLRSTLQPLHPKSHGERTRGWSPRSQDRCRIRIRCRHRIRNAQPSTHWAYMDLKPLTPIEDIQIDKVFIGSCTNSRIDDLRVAAEVAKGRKVAPTVNALVVPGSQAIKRQAEAEGLDEIFREAGFEWRESGCSMCLGMNPDILMPGERCASTSNRNFEGRQGKGGRTHLVSPQMAAGAAIAGHFVDIRTWE